MAWTSNQDGSLRGLGGLLDHVQLGGDHGADPEYETCIYYNSSGTYWHFQIAILIRNYI